MAQVPGIAVTIPSAEEPFCSAAARRMRLHRTRRRYGMRCVTTVLRKGQIEELIRRGLLSRGNRGDAAAVQEGLAQYLALVLGNV